MKTILIFSLFLLSCQTTAINRTSKEGMKADLISRKIRLTPDKQNADLVTLVIHKSSNVKNFSISEVCLNFKIKSLGIHNEEFDDLFFRNIRQCDWSNLEEVAISSKKVDLKLICSLFKISNQRQKSLLIQNLILDQSLNHCNSAETGISSLGLDDIQFNGEFNFCNTLRNFSTIDLLSILKSSEGKKELACILDLPNLNYLSLQNWKGASISDFLDLVKKYEIKYKRKLQADVEDPLGYEK
ncbi:hypothetical protein [Leptospira bandrabouensis]|uniref:Leucine-rich repeat domain-containing protein n=1 Tax=Leptospira bandrabouensis TaxID=2484903 RepID=A0A6H3NRP9_9LEPT|nr:hypothetical protein [Leptospira bandrabouensis]MCG6150475.1 hypothetical protein [Leptospira bandrabouensis]TGN05681.1 hypothetical protein EHR07_14060 [Leptospira bandrabouensis]TGN16012.1 hypothetical protein EHR08_06975 [Leptospira bandrabouensis]